MICVYDIGNTTFDGNGNAVLIPVKCRHHQVAAGKYDLSIEHPLDPYGKWQHIVPEAIIQAPVPQETIRTAFSGQDVDAYKTTASAALREGPNEPQTITYTSWDINTEYSVGAKVSWQGKNYQCNYYDETSPYAHVAPPSCNWWREIARTTPGDPVVVNLKSGAVLYYISGPSSGWYKMSTTYGLEGYIKSSQVSFWKHLSSDETKPREITNQLFRIKTVNVDSKNRMITATAEHVSYDLAGVIVDDVNIVNRNPAFSLSIIEQAFMIDYQGTLATNMVSDNDGTYTGEIKGKNGIYALLDPDKGLVANFDAMFRRDNWDLFVMRKENTDRGFRLRYGKNMIGVTWNIKSDNLINRVVPVAKDEDGSDLYLSGTKWVDSPLLSLYPVIRMERIKVDGQVGKDDGTETDTNWTAATLRTEMQKKAEERFSVDKVDLIVHEVTIDFELLGDTVEYSALKQFEKVLLYDRVVAINEIIGLSVSLDVTEIEYDCISQKVTSVKLSNVNAYGGRDVSGFNVFPNSITWEKLTDGTGDRIQQDAEDNANEYTNDQIAAASSQLKAWVTANFEPRS